jgi:hypothetical protein
VRCPNVDSGMRSVVIVLLDPATDRLPRFLHVSIFRRLCFFFLQAAMESYDATVALWVMIRRPPMSDSQSVLGLDESD